MVTHINEREGVSDHHLESLQLCFNQSHHFCEAAQEPIYNLQACYEALKSPELSSNALFKILLNTERLKVLIQKGKELYQAFKAALQDNPMKESAYPPLKQKIKYVISSCTYNEDLFNTVFNEYANNELTRLGWDLERDKKDLTNIQCLAGKCTIPLYFSEKEDACFPWAWEHYIIDHQLTPADYRMIKLRNRIPAHIEIPKEYECAISNDLMVFPTRTSCEHIFDRESILLSLKIAEMCPLCRGPIQAFELKPAEGLQLEVHHWIENQFMTITVHADLEKGDFIAIRGSEAGLSWTKGTPLKQRQPELWEIRIPFVEGCQYKLLVNDSPEQWEAGSNHTISKERKEEIYPTFNTPLL